MGAFCIDTLCVFSACIGYSIERQVYIIRWDSSSISCFIWKKICISNRVMKIPFPAELFLESDASIYKKPSHIAAGGRIYKLYVVSIP